MNSRFSHSRERLLLVIAFYALSFPAGLLADITDQDTGAKPAQVSKKESEASKVDNGIPVTTGHASTGTGHSPPQEENHWRLRFNLSWVNPTGSSVSTSIGHDNINFGIGAGAGAGLQAEYRLSPRLGIELGMLAAANFDVTSRISHDDIRGGISLNGFAPFSLGLNVHLTPEHALDLYAGPQLALVTYGNDRTWWNWDLSSGGGRASTESDWAWGVSAGLDIPLGKRGWLFNANLRYLETSIKQSRNDTHFNGEFDPAIFSIGIGYAF
jgi:outer membrane protein W